MKSLHYIFLVDVILQYTSKYLVHEAVFLYSHIFLERLIAFCTVPSIVKSILPGFVLLNWRPATYYTCERESFYKSLGVA